MGWPFSMLKTMNIFSDKIYGSNFIKQHSETVSKMLIALPQKKFLCHELQRTLTRLAPNIFGDIKLTH